MNAGLLLSAPHSRTRPRPRISVVSLYPSLAQFLPTYTRLQTHNEGISKLLGTGHAARPARRLI